MSPELQDYLAEERLLETYRDRLSPEDRAYIDAREAIDDCVWQSLATNYLEGLQLEHQHAIQLHVPSTFPLCGDTAGPFPQMGFETRPDFTRYRPLPDSDED